MSCFLHVSIQVFKYSFLFCNKPNKCTKSERFLNLGPFSVKNLFFHILFILSLKPNKITNSQ